MTQTTKETADQDKDEQYILDELAYAVERDSWFEINGRSSSILQSMLKSKDAEINLLRGALGTIAATKILDDINPDINAKMMWIGCTQIASNALKGGE
jgi:hypothetical protein